MPVAASILFVLYGLLVGGVRVAVHRHQTGSSGVHGVTGRPGSVAWTAGVGFVVALALGFLAPLLAVFDVVKPVGALDSTTLAWSGAAIATAGALTTFAMQLAMGANWRIGVDDSERTQLVTSGPFRIVRNPIYAAMIPTAIGFFLMVPNWIALTGLVLLIGSLEAQVRLVEEPYLARVHGTAFTDYASRVGRFFPGIGRQR